MGTSKTQQVGQANTASPEQSNFINQNLQNANQSSQNAYNQFLQPYDSKQFQDLFQKSFVDPAMRVYDQQVVPGIQERFGNANAGSSSALNQALASSASDLSTALGSQMGNFYQQQQQNQLTALGQLGGMSGQKILDPIIQQGYNPTGDMIGAGGDILGALIKVLGPSAIAAMSSQDYKENIVECDTMLQSVNNLKVKKYAYREGYSGRQNCIGLIAEDVPEALYVENKGIKGVDVYGLASMLVKAVQELSEKVKVLEASNANNR